MIFMSFMIFRTRPQAEGSSLARLNGWFRSVAGSLLSFEFVFLCYLFAGVIKGHAALAWLPVDFTLLVLALAAAAGIRTVAQRGAPPRDLTLLVICGVLLVFYADLSLLWSKGDVYAQDKAMRLSVLCLSALLGGALVSGREASRCRRFFWLSVGLSVVLAGEFLCLQRVDPRLTTEMMGADSIGLGRTFAFGFLVIAGSLLWGRSGKLATLLQLALAGILLVGLMQTGGRGPLLSGGAVFVLVLIRDLELGPGFFRVRRRLVWTGAGLGLFLVGLIGMGRSGILLRTLDRLEVLFSSGGGRSVQERIWFYQQAWSQWLQAPVFGHGLGSWPVLQGWPDFRAYPHNIILELLVELGLVGLLLFGLMVYLACRRLDVARLRRNPLLSLGVILTVAVFLNALVSGDLADNKILFGMIGLLAGLNREERSGTLSGALIATDGRS